MKNKYRKLLKRKRQLKKWKIYPPIGYLKCSLTEGDIEKFRIEWREALKRQSYMTFCDLANEGGDKSEITFWDTRTGKQITEKQIKLFTDMDKIKQNYSGIAPIEKLPWRIKKGCENDFMILWSRQNSKDFYNEMYNKPKPFKLE